MVDLLRIYDQITFRKEYRKLHTKDCTAEQLYSQISNLTDGYMSYVESLMPKLLCLKKSIKKEKVSPGDSFVARGSLQDEDAFIASDSKRFFEKMDEEAGSDFYSDQVDSEYLENLI